MLAVRRVCRSSRETIAGKFAITCDQNFLLSLALQPCALCSPTTRNSRQIALVAPNVSLQPPSDHPKKTKQKIETPISINYEHLEPRNVDYEPNDCQRAERRSSYDRQTRHKSYAAFGRCRRLKVLFNAKTCLDGRRRSTVRPTLRSHMLRFFFVSSKTADSRRRQKQSDLNRLVVVCIQNVHK